MSTTQGAYGNCGTARWTPFELVAIVLGFIFFWPLGLAALGYKYWQRKNGGTDLDTVAANAFQSARSAMGGFPSWAKTTNPGQTWAHGFTTHTGNAAFDEWKSAELSRLEAERRRLEDAHREFSDWLDTIRRAKDREEFERFMNERRGKAGS